jgi:hypothetical protein
LHTGAPVLAGREIAGKCLIVLGYACVGACSCGRNRARKAAAGVGGVNVTDEASLAKFLSLILTTLTAVRVLPRSWSTGLGLTCAECLDTV